MVDLILSGGQIVTVDDEDYLWASKITWRAWKDKPTRPLIAINDVYERGRSYRRHLFREIALRMRPDIWCQAPRMSVKPKNGDWFDARRENILIKLRKAKAGRPPSDLPPRGYALKNYKGTREQHGRSNPHASSLWRPSNIDRHSGGR